MLSPRLETCCSCPMGGSTLSALSKADLLSSASSSTLPLHDSSVTSMGGCFMDIDAMITPVPPLPYATVPPEEEGGDAASPHARLGSLPIFKGFVKRGEEEEEQMDLQGDHDDGGDDGNDCGGQQQHHEKGLASMSSTRTASLSSDDDESDDGEEEEEEEEDEDDEDDECTSPLSLSSPSAFTAHAPVSTKQGEQQHQQQHHHIDDDDGGPSFQGQEGGGEVMEEEQELLPSPSWRVVCKRYEVKHSLGHGAYGEVVEAWDKVDHRRVAIKRIGDPFRNVTDARRIYRELAILRRLQHPNVVALLDAVVAEDYEDFDAVYLVFELADTDMHKLTRSPQFLTDDHIRVFLYQCLSGLEYMQAAGVVHRDLKPANLLINADCSLKIADFGLACFLSSHELNNGSYHGQQQQQQTTTATTTFTVPPPSSPPSSTAASSSSASASPYYIPPPSSSNRVPPEGRGGPMPRHHHHHHHHHHQQQQQHSLPSATATTAAGPSPFAHRPPLPTCLPRLRRQLTTHVMTRWYRAPEVILHEKYDHAVDMWAMGCILAELLGMQAQSVPSPHLRSPLLPGGSCFGLSPTTNTTGSNINNSSSNGKHPQQQPRQSRHAAALLRLDPNDDQMAKILRLLGAPCNEDLQQLGRPQQRYLRTCFPHCPVTGMPLSRVYPGANPQALALLHRMLAFNPRKRITVAEALEDLFFLDIRGHDCYEAAAKHRGGGGGGRRGEGVLENVDCLNMSVEEIKARLHSEALQFMRRGRRGAAASR